MTTYNILVVDDNWRFLETVKVALKEHNVIAALSLREAQYKLNDELDIVLLDLVFDERKPDELQGLNFIPYIRNKFPLLQIVIMTNYSSTDATVTAIKAGAEDFLNKKELKWEEWKTRLENYCKNSVRIRELQKKTIELEEKYENSRIIGQSKQIEIIRLRLKDLAENSDDINIFIYGETGIGKNLAVRYFRKHSIRKDKPYVEFSIYERADSLLESELFGHKKGAFTDAITDKKGLFEEANGGILFLDEIGDYDVRTQKKIMKFIEEKVITPVGSVKSIQLNIQLLMATNQNIPELVEKGKFRNDFFQRINQIKIELPSLRERKEDIRVLTDYFFNHFRVKEKTNLISISEEVYQILDKYSWPGNVRELQSVLLESCTKARLYNDCILKRKHLREELTKDRSEYFEISDEEDFRAKKARVELEAIDKALERTYGQKAKAAALLHMNPDQLRYKVLKYKRLNADVVKKFKSIEKVYN